MTWRSEMMPQKTFGGMDTVWKRMYADEFVLYKGAFDAPIVKNYKLTACTPCMNRLSDIKLTLHGNMKECEQYPNMNMVLLDYASHDGLGDWLRVNAMQYIRSGMLSYYRLDGPKWFHNAHARNIAWRLADGEILFNVDAEAFIGSGFADLINRMANCVPNKAGFFRSRQMLRGRIGFYKRDFVEELGGFDEDLVDYSPWDRDIFSRASCLGFTLMFFGPKYGEPTGDTVLHHTPETDCEHPKRMTNYRNKSKSHAELVGRILSSAKINLGLLKANQDRHWGKARIVKNFEEEIEI